ncbi:MAG: cell surface protein SprA [Ignavibacteriales bacterium]|nr:cell surface protein SprA [Ignavibacteriales bacterium]
MTLFLEKSRSILLFPYQKSIVNGIVIALTIILTNVSYSQVPPPTVINTDSVTVSDSVKSIELPEARKDKKKTTTKIQIPDSLKRIQEWMKSVEDTSNLPSDTLWGEDENKWQEFNDSTARVNQWIHHRKDEPMVEFFPRGKYSLYLDVKSPAYKREFQIDSSGELVTIKESVNGLDVKVPLTMRLSEYIKNRIEYEKGNAWRVLAQQYTLKQGKDDLSGLLSSFTNISIPVPANPLTNIFGGNEINLRIGGSVDIRGAFRNTKSDQTTISTLDRSRNEPDFNQTVQINVGGTIGKKLNILADWNTQRTFEYENQLKIKYTGFEDEIIQSIEAGNVSLQTPSLVGGGAALFGIKAKLQAGPLSLTTLLSQKKGQTKELSVSGGSTATEGTIGLHEYSKRHFFVDTIYSKYFEQLHKQFPIEITPEIDQNRITMLDVWVSNVGTQGLRDGTVKTGKAFIDLPYHEHNERYISADTMNLTRTPDGFAEGNFVKLTIDKDYTFNPYNGYITMILTVNDADQAIAVTYTRANGQEFGGYMTDDDTTIYMRLVKPKSLFTNPDYYPAWDLMLKNIYPVKATNLKKEGFELTMWRRTEMAEQDQIQGKSLLEVLGLDRFDGDNSPRPDNKFDFIGDFTIDTKLGEVIFPSLRPFDLSIVQYFRSKNESVPDSLLFSDIYDTTAEAAQKNNLRNRYFMKVKAVGNQTTRYPLGFNIVEGSVQVLLNGKVLTPKIDYTVDYITGEVNILNSDAMLPNANVQVKFEQNDLFQIASKTLMGVRGEIATYPGTNLGFTILNLNQQTLSDKVRIGEEPTNNTMIGVDASTSANLPFLTEALDALPFFRSREMSTIRFGGEAAYMIPDPNTKKSTITGDGGKSIAYIDDFEGSRRTIPLPVMYTAWTIASNPAETFLSKTSSIEDISFSRAQLSWYNRLPTDVFTDYIWPNRKTRAGQNQVTVLNLDYDPNHRGVYNYSPKLDSTLHRKNIGGNTGNFDNYSERKKNWNGVMRYVGSIAAGILDQNISYLEVWVQANSNNIDDIRRGRLFIDIGRISEDVIPNRILNNEDANLNGVRNTGEDIGLDMKSDGEERIAFADFLSKNLSDPDVDSTDLSGDNYIQYGNGKDLRKFNGTEKNETDPAGMLPNSEDLNNNGSLDATDQYLEYELPLDTLFYDSSGVLSTNPYKVGGGGVTIENPVPWYQFRIPLMEVGKLVGGNDRQAILRNVQYVRMWVSGFSDPVSLRFAEINLVGNQWEERIQNDSLLKASVVNIEDNQQYSQEWYQLGIQREKDRTDPNQIIEANEQSLSLIIKDLPKGIYREVKKVFPGRALDLFNYKAMKMFVHGDPGFDDIVPTTYDAEGVPSGYDAELYVRFGSDTLNYYEYRQPIYRGWNVSKNNVDINFSELTSVKATKPDTFKGTFRVLVHPGDPTRTYGVRGNPSLRKIIEMSIGIKNIGKPLLNGEVWVNELRLVDVDNSPGIAYRFDTQLKLADLGQLNFNYNQTDPSFHGLDQRFGDQTTKINWAVNANVTVDKFLPQSWTQAGTTIPFSYSHTENLLKPKYLPNTDIVVAEAANRAAQKSGDPEDAKNVLTQSQTLNIRNTYAISNLRIAPPVDAWYVRETISKLGFGFNYNTSRDRDPSFLSKESWSWSLRMSYGVSLPANLYIQPFKKLFSGLFLLDEYKDWKLYFIPVTTISANTGGNRSRTLEIPRAAGSSVRDTRNFNAGKGFGFGWKFTEGGIANIAGDYSVSTDRTLNYLDNDFVGRDVRTLLKNLFFGGRDTRYGQKVSVGFKPKIPNLFDIPKYFDLSGNYSVSYGWSNSSQNSAISKGAGYDNNISLSLTFRLKSLTDPWFAFDEKKVQPARPVETKPKPEKPKADVQGDSTKQKTEPLPEEPTISSTEKLFSQAKLIAKYFIKVPLLDFETISISYSQTNGSKHNGVLGATGFKNFWGRMPFEGSRIDYGPSRIFQLGLINDPHGTLEYSPRSSFPFIGFKVNKGLRAANANLTDQFSQGNNITLRTNRSLWSGASLDLNWKVTWNYSRSVNLSTDALGNPIFKDQSINGSVERSFISIPPVLFFKVFKSNMENVGKKYDEIMLREKGSEQDNAVKSREAIAEAFEKGMEALPFLSKILGPYVPRPNWTFRWDGIEKTVGLTSIFDRLSLEHAYNSGLRKDYRTTAGGSQETNSERINYGFSPLAGVNMTFKQLLKGNFSGNFKYNSTTSYDLNLSSTKPNIVSTLAQEISLSLSYSRRGFSIPLFGLNLQNDVDITMTFSRTKNSRVQFKPEELSINPEGQPQDGSTRTLLEPRIRYVLSSRVTAAIFYRYTSTQPDATGSLIFGSTTNEAGIDIHISI